ncbi:MAG: biotin--[acetyl-CoA-carboxylase] ligase [Actinomycetota bacterium]|nr:biotin--[acetyl-CoA-carboxylase] ligase [Actinomycetota bacterium]
MSGLSREAAEALGSPLAARVDFHEEVASTQERARELAHGGAPHGTLVLSEIQKGGRGRLGRRWGSPRGGVWMSLVLRPELPARFAPRITQTAAVGVAKALWGIGVEARIKWPNDLLITSPDDPTGRKICGILAESSAENAPVAAKRVGPGGAAERAIDFVVLGVGLNANLDPEDLDVPDREVATLRSELGHDVDLPELLGAVLRSLDAELGRIKDLGAVLDDWRALNCTVGRFVRVTRFGETIEGRAVDLTEEGALLIQRSPGGGLVEVFEGEVEHLRHGEGAR